MTRTELNDRWVDIDSFTEDTNASDDLDNTSDASDSRIVKRVVQDRSLSIGAEVKEKAADNLKLRDKDDTLEKHRSSLKYEQVLKAQNLLDYESEWVKKLSLKDEEISSLKEKLSAQVLQ
ncbi:hypothetical protein L2E82_22590 [Cichorium intybus]|uniref:Uncharacterized protein n=1 Tax=Cichorium intybus TaxID=13427 RepID=A0ACB9DY60_CICIN|nr:hypothetical protein L2E82_22590 [Cichorium intybus]